MTSTRLLLDTHVFLWWQVNDKRLSTEARDAIIRAETAYVSVASAWEVAVKIAIGKLRFRERFDQGVTRGGFEPLAVQMTHAETLRTIPLHHRDPFDRMLVAQAMVEGLAIVTHDRAFLPYRVPLVLT